MGPARRCPIESRSTGSFRQKRSFDHNIVWPPSMIKCRPAHPCSNSSTDLSIAWQAGKVWMVPAPPTSPTPYLNVSLSGRSIKWPCARLRRSTQYETTDSRSDEYSSGEYLVKIRELLDGIHTKDLVVPEFQREYVWSREQAKQLMISLTKEYPVGSLLFLEDNRSTETEELRTSSRG